MHWQWKPGATCLVTGDGSLMFNLQRSPIWANKLPVKMFVLNNDGYESIRATQKNFFEGNLVGSDFRSGFCKPDFRRLAEAFGFRYGSIGNNDEIREKLCDVLSGDEPVLCELKLSPNQPRSPETMSYRRPDGSFEERGRWRTSFPFCRARRYTRICISLTTPD